MRLYYIQGCLWLALAGGAMGAPAVTSVVNAASNLGPSRTNPGIAQGAIFVAYGKGLGLPDLAIAAKPFQEMKAGGTSIRITVNGQSVDAPMYYASATQVAGLIPSKTPVGTGTLTVTFNGESSVLAPITVVQSNFGSFAVNQAGSGAAILTYADYSMVSVTKAANPGEAVVLWGTGLGPVAGDETAGPLPGDMTNIPVKVWVGPAPADVVYRGRSGCCIGEDQIVFTVPAGVTGCTVPVVVQTNGQVSNFTTMAIATGSRTCTGPVSILPTDIQQKLAGKSTVTLGFVGLGRDTGLVGIPRRTTATMERRPLRS